MNWGLIGYLSIPVSLGCMVVCVILTCLICRNAERARRRYEEAQKDYEQAAADWRTRAGISLAPRKLRRCGGFVAISLSDVVSGRDMYLVTKN